MKIVLPRFAWQQSGIGKPGYLLLLCLLVTQSLWALPLRNIDSLRRAVVQEQNDSLRILAELELGFSLSAPKTDSGLYWLQTGYDHAVEYNIIPLQAKGLMRMGITQIRYKSNYQEGIALLEKGAAMFAKIGNAQMEGGCYATIGIAEGNRSRYPEALQAYGKARELFASINDTSGLATVYNNAGMIKRVIGNYEEAIEQYLQGVRIREAQCNLPQLATLYNNIGGLHLSLGNTERSFEFIRKGLHIREGLDRPIEIAYSYSNLGLAYKRAQKYDSAIVALETCLDIYRSHEMEGHLALPLINLGKAYREKGDFEQAKQYFQESRAIAAKYEQHLNIVLTWLGEAQTAFAQKEFDQALLYGQKALVLNKGLENSNQQELILEVLFQTHEALGNNELALEYHQQWSDVRDSISTERNKTMVAVVEAEYQNERQKGEIERQGAELREKEAEVELEHSRTVLLGIGVVGLLLVLIIGFRSYRLQSRANRELQAMNQMILQQKSEIEQIGQDKDKLLSIVSHDMRGPINSLQGILDLMRSDDLNPEELERLTGSLRKDVDNTSEFLDNLLNWAKSQLGGTKVQATSFALKSVTDRVAALASKRLKTKNLTLNQDVSESLQLVADEALVRLVLRNLLNNAIKFSHPGGAITITAEREARETTISVKDEGVGMQAEQLQDLFSFRSVSNSGTANEKGTGLGLVLCREFVHLHGGQIWAESEPNKGTTISFTIPQEASFSTN